MTGYAYINDKGLWIRDLTRIQKITWTDDLQKAYVSGSLINSGFCKLNKLTTVMVTTKTVLTIVRELK